MTAYLPLRIRNILLVAFLISFHIFGCMNSAFYHPNQTIYEAPDQYNLQYEEVFFQSKDSTRLHGWFIPAVEEAVGTVIHFHGNFGNITYYLKQIYWLPMKNFNVFTFDYRGYGRSEGTPSRSGIYADSVAAVEYIMSRSDIDSKNVFVFGQSLGGANAIVAIAKNNFPGIRALAVEGTFSSYRTEARDMMISNVQKVIGNGSCLSLQLWPIALLSVTNSKNAEDFIDQVSPIPILVIHCTNDSLVLYHHSERLYKKSKEPKQLWIVRGCNHLNVFTGNPSETEYRTKLTQFFNNYRL